MRRTTLYPALALAALLAACASETTMPEGGRTIGSGGFSADEGQLGSGPGGYTGDGGLGSGTGGFTTSDGGGMGPGGFTTATDSSTTPVGWGTMGSGH